MTTPPHDIVLCAIEAARQSPCAKSKRGVATWITSALPAYAVSACFNGPPGRLPCGSTHGDPRIADACRRRCRTYCVHAEIRALRAVSHGAGDAYSAVHVKVVNDRLVGSGGPSCLPCATEILDIGLGAFWLYEFPLLPGAAAVRDLHAVPRWQSYTARQFYDATVAAVELENATKVTLGALLAGIVRT